ncbi:2-keto-3-deoxygluconate permease [Brachybacterium sp. ACRRE]|uniref:2-keto-3-deoxygluconate permease n=1 Tax=Brachybacterium sp. ACRRE TaxID=2918184 RepID=UPI001EF2785C|nr:2-keto-3-deoxygluconate permease [Brachybacterium sp. ACRRE]MCG7308881.1 2-keto-3-deoxygluconate permease [Brachybacterium sp. ACRRE]
MTASTTTGRTLGSPIYGTLDKIPGGLMVIPLILGAIVGTLAPGVLEIGSFTTALFATPMPMMALVIFATGMQITPRTIGPVAGTTGTILLAKSLIPGLLVVALGSLVGIQGVLGISILAMLATFDNSNGGVWIAFTGKYGTRTDRGAYVASALNDGPFFTMLFIGAAGLGSIPLEAFAAAVIPLLLGIVVGNIDHRWTEVMRPVPNIVIPFFAFGLGTGIDLSAVLTGGVTGILLGLVVTPFTGGLTYFAYRFLLRRGRRSGIGFVAGTTAGNSLATPAIVAAADPRFEPYVGVATVQIATAVLISAITAPLVAAWVLRRNGALDDPEADELPTEAESATVTT